jgi:hypothetical protein
MPQRCAPTFSSARNDALLSDRCERDQRIQPDSVEAVRNSEKRGFGCDTSIPVVWMNDAADLDRVR